MSAVTTPDQPRPRTEINWEALPGVLTDRVTRLPQAEQVDFLILHAFDVADAIDDEVAARNPFHQMPDWRKAVKAATAQQPMRQWLQRWWKTEDRNNESPKRDVMANHWDTVNHMAVTGMKNSIDLRFLVRDTEEIAKDPNTPIGLLSRIEQTYTLLETPRIATVAGRLITLECMEDYEEPVAAEAVEAQPGIMPVAGENGPAASAA